MPNRLDSRINIRQIPFRTSSIHVPLAFPVLFPNLLSRTGEYSTVVCLSSYGVWLVLDFRVTHAAHVCKCVQCSGSTLVSGAVQIYLGGENNIEIIVAFAYRISIVYSNLPSERNKNNFDLQTVSNVTIRIDNPIFIYSSLRTPPHTGLIYKSSEYICLAAFFVRKQEAAICSITLK